MNPSQKTKFIEKSIFATTFIFLLLVVISPNPIHAEFINNPMNNTMMRPNPPSDNGCSRVSFQCNCIDHSAGYNQQGPIAQAKWQSEIILANKQPNPVCQTMTSLTSFLNSKAVELCTLNVSNEANCQNCASPAPFECSIEAVSCLKPCSVSQGNQNPWQ